MAAAHLALLPSCLSIRDLLGGMRRCHRSVPMTTADHRDLLPGTHTALWQELPVARVLGRDRPVVLPPRAAGTDVAADYVGEGGERESGDTLLTVPCC